MWCLRGGMLALATGLKVVKFQVLAWYGSNCFTLNLFALMATAWLGMEIAYYRRHRPVRSLEWAGKWSYSLYIMHPLAAAALGVQVPIVTALFALAISYCFYLLIEKPSHRLAVACGRALERMRLRPACPATT